MIRQWNIKDSSGNSISVAAESKMEARQQFQNMIKGSEITSITPGKIITPQRRMKIQLPGVGDKFHPVSPIETKYPDPKPNERCRCGSGRKYKKCCMREDAKKGSSKG